MKYCKITYHMLSRIALAAIIISAAMSGCTSGPDFRAPEPPNVKAYTAEPLPEKTAGAPGVAGGASQRFVNGQDVSDEWWKLFKCKALDNLIRRALADSPTLAAAQAALRQAQENLTAESGARYPSINGSASIERQRFTGAAFGQTGAKPNTFNLYNASVAISYAFDLFGGLRRQLEALQSRVDYRTFELEGTNLALSANIVTTVVKESLLRAQISTIEEIAAIQEQQLKIVEKKFELGANALPDVLAQKTQMARTRAGLPPLQKELSQTRHLLAVLAGTFPEDAGELPIFQLDDLRLPEEIPVSLPSELVHKRPDIRASEALLHQASALIGIATASLYPKVTLTGNLGTDAVRAQDLFKNNSIAWSMGGSLLAPLYRGGTLEAERRAAIASYDQAMALYREVVLEAFLDVADVLRALDDDSRTLAAQAEAEAAARDALDVADKQFRLGAVSYLTLLDAQRQYQESHIALIQAQAARYADTAALFQALGGGWAGGSKQTGGTEVTGSK
jgi:NodT family efflux transporter outer membrane factor (OMF) lipoprotein